MITGKRIELNELVVLIARQEPGSRRIIAIAGAPGSGKSALADSITRKLNEEQVGSTAILPMAFIWTIVHCGN
jgi:pantothenate kinase